MLTHRIAVAALAFAFASLAAPVLADHDHEHHDMMIGRTAANQLVIEFDFDESQMLPPVNGLLRGYAGGDPGFGALHEDEPDEGLFMLADGASIAFEVVSFAPAFKAWTPGFANLLQAPGDSHVLGGAALHGHLNWHIDSDDPAYLHEGGPWTASFRLVDVGATGYTPSDTYTLTFTPEPGALGLLAIGALTLVRRRSL